MRAVNRIAFSNYYIHTCTHAHRHTHLHTCSSGKEALATCQWRKRSTLPF